MIVVVLDDSGGECEYEALLAGASDKPYIWPRLDENAAAAMCYTSGTTGHPKGVVYSHRIVVSAQLWHVHGGLVRIE